MSRLDEVANFPIPLGSAVTTASFHAVAFT
jgi:hypothetical protein